MKHRLHVLAIPHTVTHADYVACAYTQKVRKFCRMMTDLGHEVIHYGHERSDVVCAEHVTVTDDGVLAKAYGDHDWRRHQFRHNIFDHANVTYVQRTIPEILTRARPHDFLCCSWGIGHQGIARAVANTGIIPVEPGIGYTTGQFAEWRAYESHAVRNVVEGARNPQRWYSWVIPNYFDDSEFTYQAQKEDFVLFLGRVTELKGITTCVEACAHAGVPLTIAGQGRLEDVGYQKTPDHVTELGYADVEMRRDLMSRASALIIASTYLEPFGGVVVEALLSGTPIITPHFGAFAEINQDGVTGFECRTMRDYVRAIERRWQISPENCRQRGLRYTLPVVGREFEQWFDAVHEVYTGSGWTAP